MASKSQIMRKSLHIHIDSSPYVSELVISPDSASPSSESTRFSTGTSRTTPTSAGSDQDEFSVLCLYDFRAADDDQLSFRKNEILLVVKRENTGWWAAMRRGGNTIGWIPQAFVNSLTEEMAERLANVKEDLRFYVYQAEQLWEPEPESASKFRASLQISKFPERTAQSQTNRPRLHQVPVSSDAYMGCKNAPPSPTTPVPQLPNRVAGSMNMDRTAMPTQNERDDNSSRFMRSSSMRRWIGHGSPEPVSAFSISGRWPRMVERRRLPPTEDYSQPVLVLQASVPWYLKPRLADQLDVDADGQVRFGTIPALVERLLATNMENKQYQDVFLMTFRSFMSSGVLFDALIEYYNLLEPDGLNVAELEDWLERGRGRTQRKVLEIFGDWLQANCLLEQEPNIAGRLTEFLKSITPGPNNKLSKLIQEQIKDLTFSIGNPITVSPSISPRKKKNSKPQKGDILKIEAADLAEQLTVILFEMYRKILPQECIMYARSHNGPGTTNLREYCAVHDRVVSWVQKSILDTGVIKKRAEIVDYWIKVADKCRLLNNIASMSAIITALTSNIIQKLLLTMAHVSKKSVLESLSRYNDPSRGFATYRQLNDVDGPCLPFITMYLTKLVHIEDQYSDKESGPICFYKRKQFRDVILVMLRHQKEPYPLLLDDVAVFLRDQLRKEPPTERELWEKSEEVRQSEVAHTDIRKLEKAGF